MDVKNIEERLIALENKCFSPKIAGTILEREIGPSGLIWCLTIGQMGGYQIYFNGDSIEECVVKAEKAFEKDVMNEDGKWIAWASDWES
jgi:hypothetical protein